MILLGVEFIVSYCFHRIYASKKNLLNYTNLFCMNDYKNNDKKIHKCLKEKFSGRSKS